MLNVVVVGVGLVRDRAASRRCSTTGEDALFDEHSNPFSMIGAALLLFPKLALGLSGFETGVVVMPLVKGDPSDTPEQPGGPHPQHPQAADDRRRRS